MMLASVIDIQLDAKNVGLGGLITTRKLNAVINELSTLLPSLLRCGRLSDFVDCLSKLDRNFIIEGKVCRADIVERQAPPPGVVETGLPSMFSLTTFPEFYKVAALGAIIGDMGLYADRDPASSSYNFAIGIMESELFNGAVPASLAHMTKTHSRVLLEQVVTDYFSCF